MSLYVEPFTVGVLWQMSQNLIKYQIQVPITQLQTLIKTFYKCVLEDINYTWQVLISVPYHTNG